MKKWICLLIFAFSIIYLAGFWIKNADRFTKKFTPAYFSGLYSKSQYVLGPKSVGGIGDDGLYAFAGYYYFFQGGDVSAVNFEHPPLGKYLIGLSIFLFQNEISINIAYFLCLLIVTFSLGKPILGRYAALLPPSLIMIDPLFLDHTIRSQLDLPFSLFFISGVLFFLKSRQNQKFFYLSQLFWGAAFSTRFFPLLILLELFMFIVIYIRYRDRILKFIYSLVIVPVIYLLTHISFFYYHPSLIEFLRHKKWMVAWFTGTPVKPGNIIRNYYSGYLLDTADKLVKNKEWSIIQPVISTLGYMPFKLSVLYGFIVIYVIYCIFLTGGQAKFLMPVYPLLAVLAVKNLQYFYSIISQWMRPKLETSKAK